MAQQRPCQSEFVGARQHMFAVRVEQYQFVVVVADGVLRQIGSEQRDVFLLAFGRGVFVQLFAFCRKSYTERRIGQVGNIGKDVRVGDSSSVSLASLFLSFCVPGCAAR